MYNDKSIFILFVTFANMNKDLNTYYHRQVDELSKALIALRAKSKRFVVSEVLSFLSIIVFIALFTMLENGAWTLLLALAFLFFYFLIRHRDILNDQRIEKNENLKLVYEKELCYQNGDFSKFDNGKRYIDTMHQFTYDLDVFGEGSLFQRINRTISSGGSDCLAAHLSGNWEAMSATELVKHIKQRGITIAELSSNEYFVSHFKAQGVQKMIDTDAVKKAFANISGIKIPGYFSTQLFRLFIYANLTGFYFSVFFSIGGFLPGVLPLWWGMFNFFLAMLCSHKYIKLINEVVSKLKVQIRGYVNISLLVNEQTFQSPELITLKAQLLSAKDSLERLERILQKIDNRSNELGVVLFNSFGLLDIIIVRHFLNWQKTCGSVADKWIGTVGTFDVLVSMATFNMNEDKANAANVVEQNEVCYEARAIYHPFLGEKAVKNDFNIHHLDYSIITGANMAGKSTFLRTLGVNYILAMNALPVFADSMRVSVFRLFTNMRTTDDLTHGISYFNAELLRLRQLIDSLRPTVPSLIILDEILKGTNSLDKLNGSRLFLQYISEKNVTGVIATHDLELSKLADEMPGRFHNYCFEIELGERITYSYKITSGVARNQNATFLLKNILKT